MSELLASRYADTDLSFVIADARPVVRRVPIDDPVRTSFGIMRDRPAVFLRLEDSDGNVGMGEVWCNFPSCGAEHRANLLEAVILPALIGNEFASPDACFHDLERRFERLAVQSGEAGPIAQCLAGVDVALWDLIGRRSGIPLFRLFGGDQPSIAVYASGINPREPAATVQRCRSSGHTAFKLKIGFGRQTDRSNIESVCASLAGGETFMVDANQAWTLEQAIERVSELEAFPLAWLEEPMMANAEVADWTRLAGETELPIAGGENLASSDDFQNAITGNWLDVIQPDLCKWGGFSAVVPVAKAVLASGKRFCPHYLGGGVGLAASAHLLAAVGGHGMLEIDSNPNPLRENVFSPAVSDGRIILSEHPGLGIDESLTEAIAA